MADESLEDESSSQALKRHDQMSEDPNDNDVENEHSSEDKEKPPPSMTLSSSTQKKVIKNQLKSLKEQLKNIAQNSDDPTDRAIAGEEYETLQEMITIDDEFARPDNMKDEKKKTDIVRKLINFFKKRGKNS